MQKLQYTKQGDYLIPNLLLPTVSDDKPLGKYGRMRLKYLKEHRRIEYINLLTSGELHHHLQEVDNDAQNRMELLMCQMAAAQGVTEELKAVNQLEWVGYMNNIRSAAEEFVRAELIYV